MLDVAASVGMQRAVTWRQADAQQLPFEDGVFDAVVCQFGVMFFPEKARAFAEARRVLRSGGVLFFNVWDRIEDNDFAATVTSALETLFPDDPPRFLARTPYGYHDAATIGRDLRAGGFVAPPLVETLAARSKAGSARIPAMAFCLGTPLRAEIEARGKSGLAAATECAAEALARRFGSGPVDGRIQAQVVSVER
jgi:SAM-dependent methyltransferase